MAERHLTPWLSALFLAASALALADQPRVTLSPVTQTVVRGHPPHFKVTVTAGSVPLRMMRLAARPDLRHNYAEIHVTQADKPINVPVAISDPGPISESDYVIIAPGQAASFEHEGMPYALQELKPGEYKATVDVTPEIGKPALRSNTVTFSVVGP
jgi:hypothetical protein